MTCDHLCIWLLILCLNQLPRVKEPSCVSTTGAREKLVSPWFCPDAHAQGIKMMHVSLSGFTLFHCSTSGVQRNAGMLLSSIHRCKKNVGFKNIWKMSITIYILFFFFFILRAPCFQERYWKLLLGSACTHHLELKNGTLHIFHIVLSPLKLIIHGH